jgi:DNA-binding NarL/FixJ family response regulator
VSLHELRVGDLGQAIQHPSAVRSAPLTPSRGPLGSLTAKEGEVLRALMAGTPAPEVARELNVSVSTVRNHIRAILGKLGVRSQLAAVAAAYRAGWSRERRNPG